MNCNNFVKLKNMLLLLSVSLCMFGCPPTTGNGNANNNMQTLITYAHVEVEVDTEEHWDVSAERFAQLVVDGPLLAADLSDVLGEEWEGSEFFSIPAQSVPSLTSYSFGFRLKDWGQADRASVVSVSVLIDVDSTEKPVLSVGGHAAGVDDWDRRLAAIKTVFDRHLTPLPEPSFSRTGD